MTTPLNVIAVIDSADTPDWCADLLTRLMESRSITLAGLIAVESSALVQASDTSTSGLHHWLRQRLDTPRFDHQCCQTTAFSQPIIKLLNQPPAAQLKVVDVLLYLTADHTIDIDVQAVHVWHCGFHELPRRALVAITRRDPLFNLHLWERRDTSPTMCWQLVDSHALPMQTFSETDLLHAAHAALAAFCAARLQWLAMQDARVKDNETDNENTCHNDNPLPTQRSMPGHWALLKSLARQFKVRLRNRLTHEQWQLAVAANHAVSLATPLSEYTPILPPADRLWADPQVLEHEGVVHVFFEEKRFTDKMAHISHLTLDEDGKPSIHKIVMQAEHHLSYPFVFKHQQAIYMVPECAATQRVTLFKATRFPDQWEPVIDLLSEVNAVDTTLYFTDNRWWLFTNRMTHPSVDERDELWLYHAAELTTDQWQSHPLNPIVTGVDGARMAGPLFEENGVLYRPSQYGGERYGRGINLNRIDHLGTTDYRETAVHKHRPTPSMTHVGAHTFTRSAGMTLIDRAYIKRR